MLDLLYLFISQQFIESAINFNLNHRFLCVWKFNKSDYSLPWNQWSCLIISAYLGELLNKLNHLCFVLQLLFNFVSQHLSSQIRRMNTKTQNKMHWLPGFPRPSLFNNTRFTEKIHDNRHQFVFSSFRFIYHHFGKNGPQIAKYLANDIWPKQCYFRTGTERVRLWMDLRQLPFYKLINQFNSLLRNHYVFYCNFFLIWIPIKGSSFFI